MYKTHTYKDPDQQPTLYEELEENEVFTPGYDEGVYKQITPYRMTDDEEAKFENPDSSVNIPETDNASDNDKKGTPVHGDRDSEGNIYQRDVGEYVSEEMFAYLNELVYGDEGNNEQENGLSIPPDFLEGKGGIIKQGVPFFTSEGGPEPTKFKAKHTCRPVNLDEFFPAAGGVGAGVKPVKLRLPLAKVISKLAGSMNEAKTLKNGKEMKESFGDKTDKGFNKSKYIPSPTDSIPVIVKKEWLNNNGIFIQVKNGKYRVLEKGDTSHWNHPMKKVID